MFFLLLYSDNLIYFDYIRYINSLDSKKIINIIIQNKSLAEEVGNINRSRGRNIYSGKERNILNMLNWGIV